MSGKPPDPWSLLERDYWLDAVAPSQWSEVSISKEGSVVARLPYVLKRRYGIRAITPPVFTPWLGPWIKPSGAKPANELSHEHQTLTSLIDGLPAAHLYRIASTPDFTNMMACHWHGFALRTAYTYRIGLQRPESELWDGLRDTARRLCRKAEKAVAINSERGIGDVIRVIEMTFKRQRQDVSHMFPALERIDTVLAKRGDRSILVAEDAQGRIHGAIYIVRDEKTSYYLTGGGDPELRQSGAQTLAMWHAIREARQLSCEFDFLGSMVPSIEYYVRGFGARQVPRIMAEKSSTIIKLREAVSTLLAPRS